MLTPVIAMPERQRDVVQRMVEHCRRLDGTELRVIPISDEGFKTQYPKNKFANLQVTSLRYVASQMRDPFLWLEPDSPPLRPGWLRAISDEYKRLGKPFLLSGDSHPPHDIAGGIGVYPPETAWLFPKEFQHAGWDWWMMRHLGDAVGTTSLIQHSYAVYHRGKVMRDHRFPLDQALLRPNTMIFHRDKHGDLIQSMAKESRRFGHSGDMGDIIAALPTIRQMGGGGLVLGPWKAGQRDGISQSKFEFLRPLLEPQPYIRGLSLADTPHGITYDLSRFRTKTKMGRLHERHAVSMGIRSLDIAPWLQVPTKKHGRIVIARSPRYNNPAFPWRDVCRNDPLFVGMDAEYAEMEKLAGCRIERAHASNALELAGVIAGASMFVGNQSFPFWLAAGLGVPLIQETFIGQPDSVVPRENAFYAATPQQCSTVADMLKVYCAA